MFVGKSLEKIGLEEVNQLVNLSFEEGISLDFKLHFPDKSLNGTGVEEEWVRLFKVICAFANTKGGTIFVGVREVKGVASKIEGIEVENWERLRQNLIHKINNSFENSLQGIEFKQICLPSKKSVIILYIPVSYRGPHRVRLREGEHIFVKRVEANNIEMTTEEIRDWFLNRDSWTVQAQNFRMQRIENVLSGIPGPFSLTPPAIFMHLLPLGPRSQSLNFKDPAVRYNFATSIKSLTDTIQGVLFQPPEQLCYEGIFFRGELIPPHAQHLLVTTAGQLEFAAFCGDSKDPSSITLSDWEKISLDVMSHAIKFLLLEGINPPYLLFCSIVGVKNRRISTSTMYQLKTPKGLPRDRYDLPAIEIEDLPNECNKIKERLKEKFQPSFDLIWNDLNIPYSPNSSPTHSPESQIMNEVTNLKL